MNVEKERLAIRFAVRCHYGQAEKDGGAYINHPVRVMRKFTSPLLRQIAVLHDVVEDAGETYQTLANMFGKEVADNVLTLTRKSSETYFQYIRRVALNPIATKIKLADLADHLEQRNGYELPDSLKTRYLKAEQILLGNG